MFMFVVLYMYDYNLGYTFLSVWWMIALFLQGIMVEGYSDNGSEEADEDEDDS